MVLYRCVIVVMVECGGVLLLVVGVAVQLVVEDVRAERSKHKRRRAANPQTPSKQAQGAPTRTRVDRLGHAAQRLGQHDEREAQHVEEREPACCGGDGNFEMLIEWRWLDGVWLSSHSRLCRRPQAQAQAAAGRARQGNALPLQHSHRERGLRRDEHAAVGRLVGQLVRHLLAVGGGGGSGGGGD